jgi:hypothetical protein
MAKVGGVVVKMLQALPLLPDCGGIFQLAGDGNPKMEL